MLIFSYSLMFRKHLFSNDCIMKNMKCQQMILSSQVCIYKKSYNESHFQSWSSALLQNHKGIVVYCHLQP